MSETQTVNREPPGIADILAKREGALPPSMLPDEPEQKPEPQQVAQDDAEAAAAALRQQAEQWRSRATVAERERDQARRQASEATTTARQTEQRAEDANYSNITSAIEARTSEAERLKAELKSAGEAGDYGRIADINLRIGEIGGEMAQLRSGKEAYEAQRETRLREPTRTEPAPTGERTTVGMPRDQFLATRTAPTQEWLRGHDKFFTDQQFFDIVTGADAIARGRGIVADTPEYFRFIEEQAGMTTPAAKPRTNGAPPATPPSRDATPPSGRASVRPGDIYVTPEQKRVAEWMGIDPAEYAAEETELRNRGEIPHRRR